MKNPSIQDLVWKAIQYLSAKSYSAVTLYFHALLWRKFTAYAQEKRIFSYSTELSEDFIKSFIRNAQDPSFDKNNVHKLHAMKVLDDIFHDRPVKIKYMTAPVFIPPEYEEIHISYKEYLLSKNQKPRTIETKLSRVLVYLRFMDKTNFCLDQMDIETLTVFQKYLTDNYSTCAQSNIKFTLRDFFRFGEEKGVIPVGTSSLIGTIYSNKHDRLPSTYTKAEINRILESVDRTTITGKADYAMLILLTHLGMRTSDIVCLPLDSLHIEKHALCFKQQKTEGYENLPLPEQVELALADYLKNARPETDNEFLFVVCRGANKGRPYGTGALYYILNRYMQKASIATEGKRHGTHSMRHSLSSNLLKEGTSISVISGILGHSSSEITSRYLWMDAPQLRKLALEVPHVQE
ncbi:MAG: tyrosine-type recombinase/integrase [Lachnospiraceae bacterium]